MLVSIRSCSERRARTHLVINLVFALVTKLYLLAIDVSLKTAIETEPGNSVSECLRSNS